jgi:prefoldin alpha subunit
MVPITASLYVKGKLATADNVLVDVGTGYFVEKPVPDADDYLKRKVPTPDPACMPTTS